MSDIPMLPKICEILGRHKDNHPVISPGMIFNEGWMLRLVLDWFDRHRGIQHQLAFESQATWYSEAFLSSHFMNRKNPLLEKHTHADGIVGQIEIRDTRSGMHLRSNATQFMVIEAKMGSPLSPRVTHADYYDQASRTVACMAHMIGEKGLRPEAFRKLAFFVIAPNIQIMKEKSFAFVSKENVTEKVSRRYREYGFENDDWLNDIFLPMMNLVELDVISWEEVLDSLPGSDEVDGLKEFYQRCQDTM